MTRTPSVYEDVHSLLRQGAVQTQFGFKKTCVLDPILDSIEEVDPDVVERVEASQVSMTVAIPSKGDMRVLRQAIASIEDQAEDFVDVLVYDDSPQQAIDVSDLRFRIPVRVIRSLDSAPAGAGVARQALWEQAQGDIVMFVDDDMLLSRGCLRAARLALLSTKTEVSVVAFPLVMAVVSEEGEIALTEHSTLRNLKAVLGRTVGMPANLLARHNALLAVPRRSRWQFEANFVDAVRGQDSAFAGALARAGARVVLPAQVAVVHVGPTTSAAYQTYEGGSSYFEVRQLVGMGHNPGHARAHVPICSQATWSVPMAAIVVHTGTIGITQLRSSLLSLLTGSFRDYIAFICDCVPSASQLRSDLVRQALRGDSRFVSASEFQALKWTAEWVGWWTGEIDQDFEDLLKCTYGTDFTLQNGFAVDDLDRRTIIYATSGGLIRTGRVRRLGEEPPERRGCASSAVGTVRVIDDLEAVTCSHHQSGRT